MVDPNEVETLAQTMSMRAQAVEAVAERLNQGLTSVTWAGGAAQRIEASATVLEQHLVDRAQDLAGFATTMQQLAEELTQVLAQLSSIENQVRAWLATNPTAAPPWPPANLPPTGDPQWRQVQAAFTAAGIPIVSTLPAATLTGAVSAPPAPPIVPSTPVAASGDWKATLSPAESWIIQHESNFNPLATNPSSGAFGIWQGLGSTLTHYSQKFHFARNTTDPNQQLIMFRAYVHDRYGTAENAMAHWQKYHWY